MLGMIVHNRYVVDALQLDHIRCVEQTGKTRLELLDEVNEGIVIFTAHGISEEVAEKARQKGLTCVDASCSDVKETQRLVRQAIDEGADVLYIGKRNHPEAEAVLAISPRAVSYTHLDVYKRQEASRADIGIAGGKEEGLLFKKGQLIRKIPQDQIVEVLKEEILKMI